MELDGKYYFNLKIQQYSDFLQPSDIIMFSMKESCGCAGTIFEMAFQTENEKIADLIIENNEVIFELGESADKAISYTAFISEHPTKDDSADDAKITVSFVATLINLSFYSTRASETVFGTSLDMIKKMAKTYLGTEVKAEIDKPSEVEHNWLRSYETGAVTMLQAWLHMNLPKTTPLLWIDTDKIVHVSDIEKIKANGVRHRFIPAQYNAEKKDIDIPYLNCFHTTSYKFDTNLITGKNTIVNVSTVESGNDTVHVPETKPDLASTSEVEQGSVGNKVVDNKYQTDNVHNKFMICYYANKLRLVQLSSHIGNLELAGFYPKIKICDFVEVAGCAPRFLGRYIVNTKVTTFGFNSPISTIVAVCRDNTNSIENSAITPKSQVTIHNQQLTDIMQSIRTLRRVTVMGTKLLDGTTKDQIIGYCKSFKYNALNSFQVLGTPLNLNNSLEIMESLKNIGINIIKGIIDKYIPYPYNLMLENLMLDGFSFKKLLSQLAIKYLPDYMRDMIAEILGLLNDLTNLADALHKQNKKKLSDYNYTSGGYSADTNRSENGLVNVGNASGTPSTREAAVPTEESSNMPVDKTQQNTEDIKNITDEFIQNTEGLDMPIPDITLTESESLLPKEDLKELIAQKVVDYLNGQGYLIGIGDQAFLAILLGKKPLDFNTLKLINANIGNMLYARYWGTYNGQILKLGRIDNITDSVVTIPDVDITDDVISGDTLVINGADESNGTYTAEEVHGFYECPNCVDENNKHLVFDKELGACPQCGAFIDWDNPAKSTIKILEDITNYENNPIRAYTYLADVDTVLNYQTVGNMNNMTVITIKGRYNQFFKEEDAPHEVNITGTGEDGLCEVYSVEYDRSTDITTIYSRTIIIGDLANAKAVQKVSKMENGTSISKLSNQDITEFFVKDGFKDIYSTVPCTKVINAIKGAKVWIALPTIEDDIDFYINSKRVTMDVIENMDLGMYAPGGAKLYYNVYMSKDTYNSNSVTLEVRRKLLYAN